uniref:RRM domain-containing protein n=2 Tax=Macrostomum lignano TaxID=282301 RepID=A0A1I8GC45_9PLAT
RRKKRLRSNSPPRQAAAGAAQPPAAKRLRRRRQRHRSSCTNPANDSSTPVIAAVSDNLQFESGELRYIVVSGLPMSVRDAALHRAFRGVFRRRLLADADELVVVPESDTKTVLMFAGGEQAAASGWPLSARLGDNGQRLSARTVERRLRSLQFESRFPEDARLDSLRVEASDSLDYLRRWTRMYFCPVPYQIAEDIQCQHLLATNLPAKLLQSPEDLLRRFTQLMPDARSFFLPIDDVDQPLGYLLVRFDQSASCLATLRQLRRHYSLELVCVSLLEVCRLPCGYRIPVHNLLNWCCLDRPLSGPVSASVLSSAAVILDDPVRRPFVCTCHPDAVRVAPQPHLLTELARQLSVSATSSRMTATAAGTEAGALMSALMRLC